MSEGYNYTGKRYLALVRASSDKEGTTSTEAQLGMLRAEGKRLQMVCVGEIVLDGVTGSMPGKRQDLEQLLSRKKQRNDIDVLLVQRLDRLTRSGAGHGFWVEHEFKKAGIHVRFVGDDIPEGRYASTIKSMKYEAAREQAISISQRSTQGYQLALEQGRVTASSQTPFGCWRLYCSAADTPLHIIRNVGDGRQEKLDPKTHMVIETYGQTGGGARGHYRKQKSEKPLIMPASGTDAAKAQLVRDIFALHLREGLGGRRIADVLNRRGVLSPQGKRWSQRQVEVIYNNEVYTGISVANRRSSALFYQRNPNAPKPTNPDETTVANARTMPVKIRPPEEWQVDEEPLMRDFLQDQSLCALAVEGQRRYWLHIADPDRPKMSKCRHKTSDYLLSGLLVARQDGGGLVGVLCGHVSRKVRYYRHRRGRTGYIKGSSFNKIIHAQTVEKAVIDAVKTTLLDPSNPRQKLLDQIAAQAVSNRTTDVDSLKSEREQIRDRVGLITRTFDAATLADAQPEIERMKVRRHELDQQIAAAQVSKQTPREDVQASVQKVLETIENFFWEVSSLPNHLVKEWLAALVGKVVVDMETKDIEIHVALSAQMLKTAFASEKPMRLASSSLSPGSYKTHRPAALIAMIDCQFKKASNQICYDCRRRAG